MWTSSFWRQAAERAIKTAVQLLAALLVADGVDLLTLDWATAGATVGTAVLVSLLTSIGSELSDIGEPGSPSAVRVTSRK